MGCDIHLYVEVKQGDSWVTADRWTQDKYDEPGRLSVGYDQRFYRGRNYSLFAILADVRNGRGFAGIKTGEGFNPISKPRGLPKDVCKEIQAESDGWDSDGHSHSWFTISELMEYDWTQFSCLQGWVDGPNFEEFDRYLKSQQEGPEEYCGAVDGGNIKHISNEEMKALIGEPKGWGASREAAILESSRDCYTLVEWTIPYYKCCREFLGETLPKLWRLGNPNEVRIVFWFDN